MVAPRIDINVFDLALYAPRTSNAIVGCVGPATKGPVNRLNDFTDVGNFVNFHGQPADRQYSQRACIRYHKRGNQLKFVRIGGPNLATASVVLYAADGVTPILNVAPSSPGSWANGGFLTVAITHNGTLSYNLQVFQAGQRVENYVGVDNGNVETNVNNGSTRIVVALASGAGATFPAETTNPVTGGLDPVQFSGGDDGAFAKTESASSSTGGIAGRRFFGKMDSVAGSRAWENILTIDAALAGQTIARGSLGMAAVPGTVTIRAQTGAGSYWELSDDGDLGYGSGAGLGILTGSTGVLGSIDYRTGNFVIDVSPAAVTFFLTGTIDGIWTKAVTEGVGAAAAGTGAYAGNLSRFPLAPGWFNANKVVFTVPINEISGQAGLGAAGAASSGAALKTLAGWIVPGTIVLTPEHATDTVPPAIYDDGLGGFRTGPNGTGIVVPGGTINYRTGAWAVTTWDPVGSVLFPGVTAADIRAQYDIHLLNMGGGAVPGNLNGYKTQIVQNSDAGGDANAASTDPGAANIVTPISPGEVVLVISDVGGNPETYYDNGQGGWLDRPRGDPRAAAAVGGAINYADGSWSITASGVITATATITVKYTGTPANRSRRALRGTGPQFVADTTPNAAGMQDDDPAVANDYSGSDWLDHSTGEFSFELALITTGSQTFDVEDNGALSAVYVNVDILGYGDGTETIFTGQLSPAPFRREDDRLLAFQSAQASSAGAGDLQVAFATLGADADSDFWDQNVAVSTDPDNFLDFRSGLTSIQWTGAPFLDEAVFVVAEETVMHFVSRYPGDIGNERSTITEGLYIEVSSDPTLAGTIRAQILFNGTAIESFGQAADLDELADDINDATLGSDYITAEVTVDAGALDADVTATQRCGMAGAFTTADVVGTKSGNTYTGLQHFRNHEVVTVDWLMLPGQWHAPAITALQELCERPGRRAIGVIPTPDSDDAFEIRDFVNGEYGATAPGGAAVPNARVPYPPRSLVNSSQLAVFAPYLEYLDEYSNANVLEPPDGDIMMLVAQTDSQAAPWFPIAGNKRGRVIADAVKYSTPQEDRDLLYGLVGTRTEVVNSIIAQAGRGLALVGQRTTQRSPTALDRINVRWTINMLMNRIDTVAKDFLFELNDTILWREIKASIDRVLKPIIERRGLRDAFVVVDETTTTAEDIDNLTVKAKIFIKPARAAEYLQFDIILTPTGADFADVAVAG